MASKTEIGNRALEWLGKDPVTSIDSDQPPAKALRRVYDETRRSLLECHPWSFAVKRAAIPASATAPTWGYANGFPVPVDFIRLLSVENGPQFALEADPSGSQWIVTDASAPLNIKYIYDVTDTGRYPPSFVDAFAARLAFDICEDVTGSNAKNQTNADRAQTFLLEAKRINGLQKQATSFQNFGFVNARRFGVDNYWPRYGDISEPR